MRWARAGAGCLLAGLALMPGGCGREAAEEAGGAAQAYKLVEDVKSCGDYADWFAVLQCDQWSGRKEADPNAAAYQRGIRATMPAAFAKSRWASECASYQKDIDAFADAVGKAALRRQLAEQAQGGGKESDVSGQCAGLIRKEAAARPTIAGLMQQR